jgi:hypothetical protein
MKLFMTAVGEDEDSEYSNPQFKQPIQQTTKPKGL